jgi:hypothetical protein
VVFSNDFASLVVVMGCTVRALPLAFSKLVVNDKKIPIRLRRSVDEESDSRTGSLPPVVGLALAATELGVGRQRGVGMSASTADDRSPAPVRSWIGQSGRAQRSGALVWMYCVRFALSGGLGVGK